MANPEASSISFDRTGDLHFICPQRTAPDNPEGTRFAVTFMHYLPTLYSPFDPLPIAVCNSRKTAEGALASPEDGIYSNSCTMKVRGLLRLQIASNTFSIAWILWWTWSRRRYLLLRRL